MVTTFGMTSMLRGGCSVKAGRCGLLFLWLCLPAAANATVRLVWDGSATPAPPYTTWGTAAHEVQTAIDAAAVDDTIRVRDGLYAPASEILVNKRLRLESESGPTNCLLSGGGTHRVLNLSATGVTVEGLTITNGTGVTTGAGIFAQDGAMIRRCSIVGNATLPGTQGFGGGIFFAAGGTVEECLLKDNRADGSSGNGGGVYIQAGCRVARCRILGNHGDMGAGVYAWNGGVIDNSLLAGNTSDDRGAGVVADGPQSLLLVSSCTLVDNTSAFDGGGIQAFGTVVASNCVVWGNAPNNVWGSLAADYTCSSPLLPGTGNLVADPLFVDPAGGDYRLSTRSPCIDCGAPGLGGIDLAGTLRPVGTCADMGAYEGGAVMTYYVAPGGSGIPPYRDWAQAATNIQDAVNVAWPGDTVLVAPGAYNRGGRPAQGLGLTLTNRVCITNAITLRSSGGPGVTFIHGAADSSTGGQGPAAVRPLWASEGALVEGFTLRDGWTVALSDSRESGGGGAYVQTGAVLSNCIVRANAVGIYNGGGVYCGRNARLADCLIFGNRAGLGGGLYAFQGSVIARCAISNNTASTGGGGVYLMMGVEIGNSLVCSNATPNIGGGLLAYSGGNRVRQVTIAGNSAGSETGGAYLDSGNVMLDSIVCSNRAPSFSDLRLHAAAAVSNSCAPGLVGNGNLDAAPLFVNPGAFNYRLLPASPCIDAASGPVSPGALDLDRQQRLAGMAPDMGAYESHAVHYVSPTGGNVAPYLTWSEAAHELQDAVDAALDGETVLVAEGDYDQGVAVPPGGSLGCRLVLTRPVTVRAVGSQAATRIIGVGGTYALGDAPVPLGWSAVRGAYVSAGALVGFTVLNGGTLAAGAGHELLDESGGGIFLTSSGVVSNCLVTACQAARQGGGVLLSAGGRVTHCRISGNVAAEGGGLCGLDESTTINTLVDANAAVRGGGASLRRGLLINSTLTANRADEAGGGVLGYRAQILNAILFGNKAVSDPDWLMPDRDCEFSNCCASPAPPGSGHVTDDPRFVTGLLGPYRLDWESPCRDAARADFMDETTDLDGFARVLGSELDIGACEYGAAALDITNVNFSVDAPIFAVALGGSAGPTMVSPLGWENTTLGSSGVFVASSPWLITALPLDFGANAIHVWGENASGELAEDTVTVTRVMRPDTGPSAEHFVSLAGGDLWPYTNWASAARAPQRAIDTAMAGDRVRVASGTYAPAAEIVITNALHVHSESGPAATILNGGGTHRVMLLTGPATVSGFTLTQGGGVPSGAGVYVGVAAIVSNCVISSNSTILVNQYSAGGGAMLTPGALLVDCDVVGNQATNGFLYGCGGGIYMIGGTVSRCRVWNNRCSDLGGGVYAESGTLISDTLVTANRAQFGGGIAFGGGELRHVTIRGNTAVVGSGIGLRNGSAWLRNSIVHGNRRVGYGYDIQVYDGNVIVDFSCTPEIWPGTGSIQADPRFMNAGAGDLRLRADSPCIDAGGDLGYPAGAHDVAGLPRVLDGDYDFLPWPDMGAHEYHPMLTDTDGDRMADGWEYWRFLDELDPADGALDDDNDGCDNAGEYDADTNPWDPASRLRISSFALGLTGQVGIPASSTNRRFTLEFAPAVTGVWQEVIGEIARPGTGGPMLFEDVSPAAGRRFYRVRAFAP